MKFELFTPENFIKEAVKRKSIPMISVNKKTGLFRMNLVAAEKLGASERSQIKFARDPDKHQDWYISMTGNPGGFSLRSKNQKDKCLFFNNKKLAELILQSFDNVHLENKEMIAFEVKDALQHEGNDFYKLAIVFTEK